MVFVPYCKREQIDDQDGDAPAAKNIDEAEGEAKKQPRFVKNRKKGVVKHDEAENEKNHP